MGRVKTTGRIPERPQEVTWMGWVWDRSVRSQRSSLGAVCFLLWFWVTFICFSSLKTKQNWTQTFIFVFYFNSISSKKFIAKPLFSHLLFPLTIFILIAFGARDRISNSILHGWLQLHSSSICGAVALLDVGETQSYVNTFCKALLMHVSDTV